MEILQLIVSVAILLVCVTVAIFLITGLTGAPYVPTMQYGLEEAFTKLYRLKPNDLLIDLGAGNGTILAEAEKKKSKAIGIELNPVLALITRHRFKNNKKIKVACRNFYRYNFPKETTVIYAFAVAIHITPIYRKIQSEANRLNKTLYFVSNAFNVPGVKPKGKLNTFFLYEIKPEQKS